MKKVVSFVLCIILCVNLTIPVSASENNQVNPRVAVSVCPTCGSFTYIDTGVQQVSWDSAPTYCEMPYDHTHKYTDEKQVFRCTTCGYEKIRYHVLYEDCPNSHWDNATWYVHYYD